MELVPFEGLLIKLCKPLSKWFFSGPKCWYQQDIRHPTVLKKPPCGCSLWIWLLNCSITWGLLRFAWLSSRKALGLWLLGLWKGCVCSLLLEGVGSVWAMLRRPRPPSAKQTLLRWNKSVCVIILDSLRPWCTCVSRKCFAASGIEASLFCLVIPGLCRWFIVAELLCSSRPGTLHHDLIFLL